MDYFQLFDLPPAPVVEKAKLAKKYFELQRNSHPDFFTKATEGEQDDALTLSADINKAFNIFQSQDKTIEYFLQTVGMIEPDEKYVLPADFLMEMMEINESISDADDADAKKLLADYEGILFDEVKPILESYDPLKTTNEELLKIKEYYYKKKYLNRILDRLSD